MNILYAPYKEQSAIFRNTYFNVLFHRLVTDNCQTRDLPNATFGTTGGRRENMFGVA